MTDPHRNESSVWAVFLIFLRLGLTSFGGPVAHLSYFREEFVARRRWLTEGSYADLVALCQFLPGPASSQVGMAIGLCRAGYRGALAAWAGFTLPSAVALIVLALGLATKGDLVPPSVLHGLKVVAVAVVIQAVWGMARQLCPDGPRLGLMLAVACGVLWVPTAWGQVVGMGLAALVGVLAFRPPEVGGHEPFSLKVSRRGGLIWLALFLVVLMGLPLAVAMTQSPSLSRVDAFYRAGSLVFGGGHVILPLLQAEVVSTGWVNYDAFLAGYGAAQAVPGPLFTFAAFLGASMNEAPTGWGGGILCLLAIFAPSFFLVMGALPFWERLRTNGRAKAALMGVNAGVVGLLLAALYRPVWTSAIHSIEDVVFASLALVALMVWKWPPWLVVIGCGALGFWW